MKKSGFSLEDLAKNKTILDTGAADGALSFFFESLGCKVESWDYVPTNMNRMAGLYDLAQILGSGITIQNVDLDDAFNISGRFDLCLFLGLLYHLKTPFYVLEKLARHAHFCFLSTRIARQDPEGTVNFGNLPVAYLVDADQGNNDATNFWIFSPAGLTLLAHRTGWDICASVTSGTSESNPSSPDRDERMFLLLRTRQI